MPRATAADWDRVRDLFGVVMREHAIAGLRALVESPPEGASSLEPLLTAADLARILGVRLKRVYELGIPAVRLSEKCLRWRRSDVQAWLQDRTEGGRR